MDNPVYIRHGSMRQDTDDLQAAIDALLCEPAITDSAPDHVYLATILGDMQAEQQALSETPVPYILQRQLQDHIATRICCPLTGISAACVSGAAALAIARARIAGGTSNRTAILGYEQLTPFLYEGFKALQCLTDSPLPYTVNRQGFRLNRGIGCITLSSEKAPSSPAVRVAGAITTNDAAHLTAPDRSGAGLQHAIEKALNQAGLSAHAVDTIKLNGAGTGYSDRAEINALLHVFGKRLPDIPCLCLKQQIGHTQGAAGVLETILAADALKKQMIPGVPQSMIDNREYPLDFTFEDRTLPVKTMLLLFSGMGGQNAAIVLQREDA